MDLGWAQVTTQQAVGVQVVFRILNPSGNLITAANIRVGPITTAASLFGVQNGAATAIALLNPPGNPPATISIQAIGSDGNSIATRDFGLQPGEKKARFLIQFLPSLGSFDGSIEIRSTNMADPGSNNRPPVAILPILQEGLVLTAQDAFPPRQRP